MVGDQVLAHYVDGEWRSLLAANLRRVDFAPDGTGMALGWNHPSGMRYLDGEWQPMAGPARLVQALDIVSERDAWAIADTDIYHFDGESWELVASPGALLDIDVLSEDVGWAAGVGGQILRYDGHRWRQVANPTQETISSLSMLSTEEGWAVGQDGLILRCQAGVWERVPGVTNRNLRLVRMASDQEGWAVGAAGQMEARTQEGELQILLHYHNGRWQIEQAPTERDIVALEMISEDDGWMVTEHGTVYRLVDGRWQLSAGLDTPATDLTVLPSGDVWIVGSGGALWRPGSE
jgi:photosystem II stability/assembly factor-like uncharacterized protein